MDRPSESFAKSATKQRFHELINSRPSSHSSISSQSQNEMSSNSRRRSTVSNIKPPSRKQDDVENGNTSNDNNRRKSEIHARRYSQDTTEAVQRLRSRADGIRNVLDNTVENEEQIYNKKPLRRPSRMSKGETNPGFIQTTNIDTEEDSQPDMSSRKQQRRPSLDETITSMDNEIESIDDDLQRPLPQHMQVEIIQVQSSMIVRPRRRKDTQSSSKDIEMTKIVNETEENNGDIGILLPPNRNKRKQQLVEKLSARKSNLANEITAEIEPQSAEIQENITSLDEQTENLMSLQIHRTDKVAGASYLHRVVVRVTIVDVVSGMLLRKISSIKNDAVDNANESKTVNYFLPVLTQVCDLPASENAIPFWEETIFMEDCLDNENTIIFFELLNFGNPADIFPDANEKSKNPVFHHIAWAFFKLTGKNKTKFTGRRMRLQLYIPARVFSIRKQTQQPESPIVYKWWKSKQRSQYPSTLHITLSQIPQLENDSPMPEKNRKTYKEIRNLLGLNSATDASIASLPNNDLTIMSTTDISGADELPQWNRQPNQPCLIPNSLMFSLDAGHHGASVVKFSHNGRKLAVGGFERTGTGYILIYLYPSGRLKDKLSDFRGIIYDVEWSNDDNFLLTACADGTNWNLSDYREKNRRIIASLPHPGFVYCSRFHPKKQEIIATGCYDGIIRIWSFERENSEYSLLQELIGHDGFINVLLFHHSGNAIFSAGNDGFVRQWSTNQETPENWTLTNSSTTNLLGNVTIVDLQWSSKTKQLLALNQNGEICFLDKNGLVPVRQIPCSLPFRHRVRFRVSPCGRNLYVPNIDGVVQVIDVFSGKMIGNVQSGIKLAAPMDVDYHPFEHSAVFCSLGVAQKVMVWGSSGLEENNQKGSEINQQSRVFSPGDDGDGRDLFSPMSAGKTDKITDVINKLDLITRDLRIREQRRLQEPVQVANNSAGNRLNDSGIYPVRSPHWGMRQGILSGLVPNLSQI